jgi:hypothetical protein
VRYRLYTSIQSRASFFPNYILTHIFDLESLEFFGFLVLIGFLNFFGFTVLIGFLDFL